MKIVECDLRTRYQQVSMLDDETGEFPLLELFHHNQPVCPITDTEPTQCNNDPLMGQRQGVRPNLFSALFDNLRRLAGVRATDLGVSSPKAGKKNRDYSVTR